MTHYESVTNASTTWSWIVTTTATTASTANTIYIPVGYRYRRDADFAAGQGQQYVPRADHVARDHGEERRRDAARSRAAELLDVALTEEGRRRWREESVFEVLSSKGSRFVVVKGRVHNVFRLGESGRVVEELCALPNDHDLPYEDVVLAQKLALESDEDAFVKIANRWKRDESVAEARDRTLRRIA